MQIATFAEKKCISLKHILALPMLGHNYLTEDWAVQTGKNRIWLFLKDFLKILQQ